MSAQVEDGFTKLANEILEEIPKYKLNGTQYSLLMVVWRYTYGFNRKDHQMSISFFEEGTGICRSQIDRELKSLIDLKVLTVTKESTSTTSRRIGFNKHFDQWGCQLKRGQSAKKRTVSGLADSENRDWVSAKIGTQGVSELADQEIHSFKDNIKDITTTTDDDFFEPLIPPTTDQELTRVEDVYFDIHKRKFTPKEWPDVTKTVTEFGADKIIQVMQEKSLSAVGEINSFRYYIPAIKDREVRYRNDGFRKVPERGRGEYDKLSI